jgi:quercetin dioxygenase-like cupin family protein
MASRQLQYNSERAVVTKWTFLPGQQTGWHRHEHEYLVVPLCDGFILIEDRSGLQHVRLEKGGSYRRPAGVEHNVVNAGVALFEFVEVELPLPAG